MDHFEMTEKLREKANVTYEEAKAALEASDWDLLEAIVHLENQGKVETPKQETKKQTQQEGAGAPKKEQDNMSNILQNITNFITNLVEKGNRNALEVRRNDRIVLTLPLTVLVLLMLVFWITIPALIISLFFGCRYRFTGRDISQKVNDAMDTVANKAEDLKDSLQQKAATNE
jgi:hypothetical protein